MGVQEEDRLMPFSEIELKHIENIVGKMCERRSPAPLRDKLRITFQIKGHNVTVYEERPRWDNPNDGQARLWQNLNTSEKIRMETLLDEKRPEISFLRNAPW